MTIVRARKGDIIEFGGPGGPLGEVVQVASTGAWGILPYSPPPTAHVEPNPCIYTPARCNGGGYDGCACGPYSKKVSS